MTYFTYNGRSSADFGLHIEKKDVFSAPEYDAEFISIPGRSGDIINPNRRFANIKVSYTVFLARKNIAALAAVLRDIKGWLYSEPDRYHEITDSYDAEYFRYGVISGSLDIEEQLNKIGCFTVTFNCKPFKYSFAGQQTVTVDASELTITNPTAFESRPYIKLYGSGTVVIMIQPQGRGMMISNLDEYIEIDSELMNCFKGTALKNDTVSSPQAGCLYHQLYRRCNEDRGHSEVVLSVRSFLIVSDRKTQKDMGSNAFKKNEKTEFTSIQTYKLLTIKLLYSMILQTTI